MATATPDPQLPAQLTPQVPV